MRFGMLDSIIWVFLYDIGYLCEDNMGYIFLNTYLLANVFYSPHLFSFHIDHKNKQIGQISNKNNIVCPD